MVCALSSPVLQRWPLAHLIIYLPFYMTRAQVHVPPPYPLPSSALYTPGIALQTSLVAVLGSTLIILDIAILHTPSSLLVHHWVEFQCALKMDTGVFLIVLVGVLHNVCYLLIHTDSYTSLLVSLWKSSL